MEPQQKPLMAIVLAGGKGTRMRSDIPKVCHLLSGKPLVAHVLGSLQKLPLEKTVVVVGYRAGSVHNALAPYRFSALDFIVQEEQYGTGHAVRCALEEIADFQGDVLVRYGDTPLISPQTLRNLVSMHRKRKAAGTFLTALVSDGDAYGRILRNDTGDPIGVREARNASEEERAIREINVGAYCFEAAALRDALEKLEPNSVNNEYYLTDVIGILSCQKSPLATLILKNNDEMHGINTPEDLARAEARSAA